MPIPYRLLREPLFRLPAETAHGVAMGVLERALAAPALRRRVARSLAVRDPRLHVRCLGIDFPNPVGLAAGFDKDGTALNALGALGFGFVEIGTVTAQPQPGNPRPRLFRLPADEALLNRMGFNNAGAEAVARTLAATRIEPILGINLGKSKVTPIERATDDYLTSLRLLRRFARYIVINVSSPNTPGLRSLQEAEPLRALVRAVSDAAGPGDGSPGCPVLVKLAPDLTDPQVDEAVEIALGAGAQGIVATNTTISRAGLRTATAEVERLGAGGISGAPVRPRALEVVRRIRARAGAGVPIIGVGGIFSGQDAWERLRAGATLVQLYTGFVYGGPGLVRRINLELLERMEREGVRTLSEIVGTDAKGAA